MFASRWWSGVRKDATRTLSLKQLENFEDSHSSGQMARTLTFGLLLMMVVANVIGAGVFVMTGTAANKYAGPAVMMSFLGAGTIALLAGVCYAWCASKVRGAGSAVTYSYVSLGQFPAYMIGWDLFCEVSIGSAAVACGWSANFTALLRKFGMPLPEYLTTSPSHIDWLAFFATGIGVVGGGWLLNRARLASSAPATFLASRTLNALAGLALLCVGIWQSVVFFSTLPSINLPAVIVVWLVSLVLLRGVSEAAWITTALTVLKLLVLLVFVGLGVCHFDSTNLQPFTPFGLYGVMHGASIVFFAYVGFESVTTSAAECKDPQRDIPRAIMWGVLICTFVYMVVSTVLVAAVPYTELDGSEAAAPMAIALEKLGYGWGFAFVAIGSSISLLSVLLISQYGLSRLARSLSMFKLLPPVFGKLNRFKTPMWSTLIFGQIVATAAALLPIDELAHLCNIGTLAAFILVCAAAGHQRVTDFAGVKTSFTYVRLLAIPVLGIIGCLVLIAFLPPSAWIRFVLWMIPGALYWVIRARHTAQFPTESAPQ
jgi:APA family basic amino acid/polyamine antiporter